MKYLLAKVIRTVCAAGLSLSALLYAGCEQQGGESAQQASVAVGTKKVPGDALAVIGDTPIDARQLRAYEAEIQPVHRSTAQGSERHRDHLLSLIDEKLIILEAEEMGLGDEPELRESLRVFEIKTMVETYLHQTVGQNITITEDELRESFESHPARFAVRGAHILVGSRSLADSLYALIAAGQRSFEELAREYSLDDSTAANGGAFDTYYAFDRVSDQIYREVFSMEVGHVSEPFRTAQGWELAKVVDKKLVPYEKYRTVIQRSTMMAKFNRLKQEHIDSLQYKLNLRVNEENLRAFLSAWNEAPGSPNLTPELFAASLYVYDGGAITLEQAMYVLINTGLGSSIVDSIQVDARIRSKAAPDLLLAEIARTEGYDKNPSVLRQVASERERKLLEQWWNSEMEKAVEISEEEMRDHYDAHPERYKIPAEIVFQEIMVAERAQAEDLLEQIRQGADMADLATRHSIRRYSDENGGLFAMRAFEQMIYKELMGAAVDAPLNELLGPVEIKEPMPSTLREPRDLKNAFSVFKVLERIPERVQTFEASKEKALFYTRQAKQYKRVERISSQLRKKYVSEWGIDEGALAEYTQQMAEL